mgnify:CR=1 FL=1
MVVVKVTRNRQVTTPVKISRALGIREGDYVDISISGEKIIIRKIKRLDEIVGSWGNVDKKKLLDVIRERWRHWSTTA